MKYFLFTLFIVFAFSCSNETHFITDNDYRIEVENDFLKAKELASERSNQLFSVFDQDISLEEKEALQFLLAYMPLSDLADYKGDFFLNNVRYALKTKETFPWVKDIPEDIFRHYVLPYRVNNENLDTARQVFYQELKVRLEGLNIEEAALEVNHWCHEKVTYKGTDIRTISPLAAIKSGYGRCGEESTFTVTAMRAAGIPARQCYTPRWAHADDNHAWVEVYINGDWKYLGACEPEPVLNKGWFTGPAMRAMLVHSKAFGNYNGSELITNREAKYSMINMLENYAPVKKISVSVVREGEPVSNVQVEFQLYNYAEFFPIASKLTDNAGMTDFTTGYGDLIVWAYDGNEYAFQKITVETTDHIVLSLQDWKDIQYDLIYDIIPPISRNVPEINAEGKELNSKRLKEEDSIRISKQQYYISKEEVFEIADKLNYNDDELYEYFQKSRGNWSEIKAFVINAPEENAENVMALLSVISDKDFRDTEANILLDALIETKEVVKLTDRSIYDEYILNPRVANENLKAYKSKIVQTLSKELEIKNSTDIKTLIDWTKTNIIIDKKNNYYSLPISPLGVMELKVADANSRDIFFVAACRSFGFPARLNEATNIPQYYNGQWVDVKFEAEEITEQTPKGFIQVELETGVTIDPKYRIHYSLSKFEDGKYNVLEYGWGKPFSEMDKKLEVEEGKYLLLTGNRMPDGNTLTRLRFFTVKQGETKKIGLYLREANKSLEVLGKIEINKDFTNIRANKFQLTSEGTKVIAWLDPEKEPTKHTLIDIQDVKEEFEASDIQLVFFFKNKDVYDSYNISEYQLPENTSFLIDENWEYLNQFTKQSTIDSKGEMPFFTLLDDQNIYFVSRGYQIGIGEQLLKLRKRLR